MCVDARLTVRLSWQGIECLTALESLNLYYNRISSLAEVFRLHSLAGLLDVDLRLNPVVKSESDYRLFVVHMLPGLQQLGRPAALPASLGALLVFGSTRPTPSLMIVGVPVCAAFHPCSVVPWRENPKS